MVRLGMLVLSLLCVFAGGVWAVTVSDSDLAVFSDQILNFDPNHAGSLVSLNTQFNKYKNPSTSTPLLKVDPKAYNLTTIGLLNQVFKASGTSAEKSVLEQFIQAVAQTRVMEYTRSFLQHAGSISGDANQFKALLKKLWLTTYTRCRECPYSSGFKHVFMAEEGNSKTVNGLHNWVYFSNQEAASTITDVNVKAVRSFTKNPGSLIVNGFKWNGLTKYTGSMFVGTSPEVEMALYTTCFLLRMDQDCSLYLGGISVNIRTYKYIPHGTTDIVISTAYPS